MSARERREGRETAWEDRAGPPQAPFSKQTPLGVLCCLQAAPRVQAALGLEDIDGRLAHGRRRGGRTVTGVTFCHSRALDRAPWGGLSGCLCLWW